MQSPLPDSSALEAGIVADTPSQRRTTSVQDTVRSLLSSSVADRFKRSSKLDEASEIEANEPHVTGLGFVPGTNTAESRRATYVSESELNIRSSRSDVSCRIIASLGIQIAKY